jgi:hypothetical protein
VSAVLSPLFIASRAKRIVDLAGGLGLFSAQVQKLLRIPCLRVDACAIPDSYITHDKALGLEIISRDVFDFLSDKSPSTQKDNLVLCSHFVEHLDLPKVNEFLNGLSSRFDSSLVCIYMPSAETAVDDEANFLHFNTHYPGEHRIIWSHGAFRSLLSSHGIEVIDSDTLDADSWYIFRV